jgi:hypothetical protein
MPPTIKSRHLFTSFLTDDANRIYLTARRPFGYRAYRDTIQHRVVAGDTLFHLASRHLFDAGLWWVIGDFQPEPIHDPTVRLDVTPGLGATIFIPSFRVVHEEILNELRRTERS